MMLPRPKPTSTFIHALSFSDLALICLRMKGGRMRSTALLDAVASLSRTRLADESALARTPGLRVDGGVAVINETGEQRADAIADWLDGAGINDATRARLAMALLGRSRADERIDAYQIRGAIVHAAYGMRGERPRTRRAVRESLVLHGLRSLAGDALILPEPGHSSLDKLDGASGALLLFMAAGAATERDNVDSRAAAIAARAVGAKKRSLEALSQAIIAAAISAGQELTPEPAPRSVEASPADPPLPSATRATSTDFSERVQALAEEMTTPPFSDRVAIASLYDAYGLRHEDAGSLSSFKDRLIIAKRAGQLQLRRLDYISAMDRELAERSRLVDAGFESHFVSRKPSDES